MENQEPTNGKHYANRKRKHDCDCGARAVLKRHFPAVPSVRVFQLESPANHAGDLMHFCKTFLEVECKARKD